MKQFKRYALNAMTLLAAFLTGCADNDFNSEGRSGDAPEVVLQIKTPQLSVASRAMSLHDEEVVKDLKVLVFKENASDASEQQENFAYVATVLGMQENSPSEGITQVRVKLTADASTKSRLVLIANHPNPSALAEESLRGKTKAEVFAALKTNFTSKWAATEGTSTIPLWGESNLTQVTTTMNTTVFADYTVAAPTTSSPIGMLRALARVDVGVAFESDLEAETTDATANVPFTLKEVYVYRSATSFLTAPGQTAGTAKQPVVPTGVTYMADTAPLAYTLEAPGATYVREIYLPERTKGTTNDDAPCLVIGGYYNGSTTVTYYRADFVTTNSEGAASYLDILRNHRYRFNLTKVSGPGFETKEQALRSKPENVQYTVTVWNQANLSEVVTDGQYMLGVDNDELTFYRDGSAQPVAIRTDWPEGWTATVTEGSEWLQISPATGEVNEEVKMSVKPSVNETGEDRVGKIRVTAGRMNWEIAVTQLPISQLSLEILDDDGVTPISMLQFGGKGGEKKVLIKYEPALDNVLSEPDPEAGSTFTWTKIEEESQPGLAVYHVTAQKLEGTDIENTISSTASFNVAYDGKENYKALVLMQRDYNALPFVDAALTESMLGDPAFYVLDGQKTSFYVKANTPYKLELIENAADETAGKAGTLIPAGMNIKKSGNSAGEKIDFTPANGFAGKGEEAMAGYAKFKLTSPDDLFDPKEFTIFLGGGKIQPEANTYLMKPGRTGVLIPAERINTAKAFYDLNADQLRDNFSKYGVQKNSWNDRIELPAFSTTNWTARVEWADVAADYAGAVVQPRKGNDGILMDVRRVVVGGKDYLFAFPGRNVQKTGNVLVALNNGDTNKIMWSWHLWIVDEYPFDGPAYSDAAYTGTILNRDLGALKPNQISAYTDTEDLALHGMLYQWGRKDPFAVSYARNTTRKLINADGSAFQYGVYSGYLSMKESIEQPSTMVTGGNNWLWEAGADYQGERVWYNLWGGSIVDGTANREAYDVPTDKAVFDPSPYGWKVPNCGKESEWSGYGPYLSKGSFFYYSGNPKQCRFTADEAFRLTSNVYSTVSGAGYRSGTGANRTSLETGNYTWSRQRAMSVRSVANEKETDYRQYLP